MNAADPSGMVTVPLLDFFGGFGDGGFGGDWNEFDLLEHPIPVYGYEFQYGTSVTSALPTADGFAPVGTTNTDVWGWGIVGYVSMIDPGDGGGGGSDPAAKGLKAAKLMVLKPNCVRFITNLVFAVDSTLESGPSGFQDAMTHASGAPFDMVQTLSETTYTTSSDVPQAGGYTTIAHTNAGSRAVTLYGGYGGLSGTGQGQTLIHEGVHDAFGFSDQQLAGALTGTVYPNTPLGTAQASVAFNDALKKNCK